jgi:hypothetical protein
MDKAAKPSFNKQNLWNRICLALALFYIAFALIDFLSLPYGNLSSILKFIAIIILFISQIALGREGRAWWKLAAFLTILTDYFLLFTNYYSLGVFLFIGVHCCRLVERKKKVGRSYFVRLGLVSMGLFILALFFLNTLNSLAVLYGFFLITNTVEAIRAKDRKLTLAYLLFCACDICVALFNVLPVSYIRALFGSFIWVFYMPSQVLLADKIIA